MLSPGPEHIDGRENGGKKSPGCADQCQHMIETDRVWRRVTVTAHNFQVQQKGIKVSSCM